MRPQERAFAVNHHWWYTNPICLIILFSPTFRACIENESSPKVKTLGLTMHNEHIRERREKNPSLPGSAGTRTHDGLLPYLCGQQSAKYAGDNKMGIKEEPRRLRKNPGRERSENKKWVIPREVNKAQQPTSPVACVPLPFFFLLPP